MSEVVDFVFCELPATPPEFDIKKFKEHDPEQIALYNKSKKIYHKKFLKFEDLKIGEPDGPNYAREVPKDCVFIDFDNIKEAEDMLEIIIRSGLRCLILKTIKGYHFLFRKPSFYDKEMTRATNWFGYKFDCKGYTEGKTPPVQIIKVCGMDREEFASWKPKDIIAPAAINTENLDILPYWLWGKLTNSELHKGGKPGDRSKEDAVEYTLEDNPFTQLMKMSEGGRHNHIVERCSYFGVSNGFKIEEFKDLIQVIHDAFLVKIGSAMSHDDMFGDLKKRWDDYEAMLHGNSYEFNEEERKWEKVKARKDEKIDERRAAEYLFKQFDFYGGEVSVDGTFKKIYYKTIDGPYEYKTDLTVTRGVLRGFSEQNFKDPFFKEMEVQLMQMCAEHNKLIKRNSDYIIVKNKVLNCNNKDAFDFSWIGKRPPTDVVLPWSWQSEEWVKEHAEDLGGLITKFIKELSRNSRGVPQPEVEQWLWVIAGASMIPANKLQKIVVLSGGGQNGKSLYTSLIRLCLGDNMFNESKIFDSNPQEKFWGEDLDKGILCVIDDLNRTYNRDAFSYIKGALTGTDSVWINEKYKPKKRLDILPQIIACTNFEFELYDKSEGMRRRVKILPTEYHIDDRDKDLDLEYKLVLNTTNNDDVSAYRMSEDAFNKIGTKVMYMYTGEKGVLDSLKNGSLCWFANKARYEYMNALGIGFAVEDSAGMKEKFMGTFSGGFDAELEEFLEWYVTERKEDIWTRDLYTEYIDWHEEIGSGENSMKEKVFSMKLGKTIDKLNERGYKLEMRKALNEKRMSLNKLFIEEGDKGSGGSKEK